MEARKEKRRELKEIKKISLATAKAERLNKDLLDKANAMQILE